MTTKAVIIGFVFVIGVIAQILASDISLTVTNHHSCHNPNNTTWDQLIRFPSHEESPVVPDEDNPGCYKLGGDIRIDDQLLVDKELYIHIEMLHSTGERNEANECYDYDKDTQCGGFGGNCVYCDFCNEEEKEFKTKEVTKIWMTFNGEKLDCTSGLKTAQMFAKRAKLLGEEAAKAFNKGLYLHFCMPSEEQFLKTKGVTMDLWNKLNDNRNNNLAPEQAMYMTIRVLNKNFMNELKSQRVLMKLHESKKVGKEPTPLSLQANLPFNRIIWGGQNFVGCHKIMGNVKLVN